MGKNTLRLICAMTGLTAGLAPALAADFLPPVPAPPVMAEPVMVPAPVPVEIISGWYVRGDVGYMFFDVPSVSHGATALTDPQIEDQYFIGIGAGYHFTKHIRGDVTLDYLAEANVTGRDPVFGGSVDMPVQGVLLLANAYFDLGEFFGLTPYIGGGIGFAHLETDELVHTGGTGSFTVNGDAKNTFAWAVTGGVNYRLDANWSIDTNYRYLDAGEAQTAAGPAVSSYVAEDLVSHEVRIGLRYDIN